MHCLPVKGMWKMFTKVHLCPHLPCILLFFSWPSSSLLTRLERDETSGLFFQPPPVPLDSNSLFHWVRGKEIPTAQIFYDHLQCMAATRVFSSSRVLFSSLSLSLSLSLLLQWENRQCEHSSVLALLKEPPAVCTATPFGAFDGNALAITLCADPVDK